MKSLEKIKNYILQYKNYIQIDLQYKNNFNNFIRKKSKYYYNS